MAVASEGARRKQSKSRSVASLHYEWRGPARFSIDAQVAGQALETICDENGGSITPQQVVEASRDLNGPLHSIFEWRDTRAADKWRDRQAKVLIASVLEVRTEPDRQTKTVAFVNVKAKGASRRSYHRAERVANDAHLRQQAINEALRLLNGVRKRFAHLTELAEIFAAIEALSGTVDATPQPTTKRANTRKPRAATARS